MTTYKELLMKRDAFRELRTKIRNELAAHSETTGGEILSMDTDPDTGDLLVTGQYKWWANETVTLTHRITITEEPGDA